MTGVGSSNHPENSAGTLILSTSNNPSLFLTHFFISAGSSRPYIKHKINGAWGEWADVALKSDLTDIVKVVTGQINSVTISGSSSTNVQISIAIPSGYKIVDHIDAWPDQNSVFVSNRWLSSNESNTGTITAICRNVSTSEVTTNVFASALIIKV